MSGTKSKKHYTFICQDSIIQRVAEEKLHSKHGTGSHGNSVPHSVSGLSDTMSTFVSY